MKKYKNFKTPMGMYRAVLKILKNERLAYKYFSRYGEYLGGEKPYSIKLPA